MPTWIVYTCGSVGGDVRYVGQFFSDAKSDAAKEADNNYSRNCPGGIDLILSTSVKHGWPGHECTSACKVSP